MDFDPDEIDRVKQLFQAAMELPAEKRPAFLHAEAGRVRLILRKVERMITQYDTAAATEARLPNPRDLVDRRSDLQAPGD